MPYEDTRIIDKKYIVTKKDGRDSKENSTYFVIKATDQAFTHALIAYATKTDKKNFCAAAAHLARHHNYDAFRNIGIPIKYNIFYEATGEPVAEPEKYFVFKIDTDDAAKVALRIYASHIDMDKPGLSKDIIELIESKTWSGYGIKSN